MQQSYKVFTVIGILFTILLGSLSHFFNEWSGNFFLVGLFSPVNESVWEHLKLLFFPALLFMLLEQRLLSYRCPDLLCKNLTGLYAGLLSMPLSSTVTLDSPKKLSVGRYRNFHTQCSHHIPALLRPPKKETP
ncbi:MAG: DUF6512 family protein [Blautia marasmi]